MVIEIDGVRYGKIEANLERRTGRNQWVEMTLTEGKNREVRKVLEHFGLQVSRSEEHTSELQSLMRISYAVFCLKKKKKIHDTKNKKQNENEQHRNTNMTQESSD